MISFKNDYSEGAHPQILNQILKINAEQNIGYGQDQYSDCLLYTSPSPRD